MGGGAGADRAAPHHPEHDRHRHGQRHLPGRRRDPARRRAQLPRPRHPAARCQLGRDALQRPELHLLRLLVAGLPAGRRDRADRGLLQLHRRRAARRVRGRGCGADERDRRRRCSRSRDLRGRHRAAPLDGPRGRRRLASRWRRARRSASSASPAAARRRSGLALLGLLPAGGRIAGGSIRLDGRELVGTRASRTLRRVRGDRIGIVFQDPLTSLNPTMTIGDQVGEPLRIHRGASARAARGRARRAARARRPAAPGAAARPLPARALRRDAPARLARDRARLRPGAARRRRADDGARRDDAGSDPRAVRAPASASSAWRCS